MRLFAPRAIHVARHTNQLAKTALKKACKNTSDLVKGIRPCQSGVRKLASERASGEHKMGLRYTSTYTRDLTSAPTRVGKQAAVTDLRKSESNFGHGCVDRTNSHFWEDRPLCHQGDNQEGPNHVPNVADTPVLSQLRPCGPAIEHLVTTTTLSWQQHQQQPR